MLLTKFSSASRIDIFIQLSVVEVRQNEKKYAKYFHFPNCYFCCSE